MWFSPEIFVTNFIKAQCLQHRRSDVLLDLPGFTSGVQILMKSKDYCRFKAPYYITNLKNQFIKEATTSG